MEKHSGSVMTKSLRLPCGGPLAAKQMAVGCPFSPYHAECEPKSHHPLERKA